MKTKNILLLAFCAITFFGICFYAFDNVGENEELQITDQIINLDDFEIIDEGTICTDKINRIMGTYKSISLPTVENFANRERVLFNAKSYPVFLFEEPVYEEIENKTVKKYRDLFNKNARGFLQKYGNFVKYRTDIGAGIFLRSGYFYHPNPAIAQVMSQFIGLDSISKKERLWVQRGDIVMRVHKVKGKYYFVDGPFKDQYATIMIFDRITEKEPIKEDVKHIDFTPLQHKLGFSSLNPIFINHEYIIAEVNFAEHKVFNKILFWRSDNSIDCETSDTSDIRRENKGLRNFQSAILANVVDAMPFDEPKHEVVQEDGKLRDAWIKYFYKGRTTFRYTNPQISEFGYVYNRLGKPIPPQVCVDFLVDSMDRGAGSWYTNVFERNNRPKKNSGKFNSSMFRYEDDKGEEQHYAWRNAKGFEHFVTDHPEWFKVIYDEENVEMGNSQFPSHMKNLMLSVGDMVFVKGAVPWDKVQEHTHSFIIYETDPISGMPVLLAGNAGTASLRPWKIETTRTPRRSIFMIVRPRPAFLNMMTNEEYKELIPR